MKLFFQACLAIFMASGLVFAGEIYHEEKDDSLLQAFCGNYIVTGVNLKSGKPYTGTVEIRKSHQPHRLAVIWKIKGRKNVTGIGILRRSIIGETEELAVFFQDQEGYASEAVYLFKADYDNYLRLTGMIHQKRFSEQQALEALFPQY